MADSRVVTLCLPVAESLEQHKRQALGMKGCYLMGCPGVFVDRRLAQDTHRTPRSRPAAEPRSVPVARVSCVVCQALFPRYTLSILVVDGIHGKFWSRENPFVCPRLGYLCAFAENASAVSLSITHRGTASRDYHPPLLGPENDWLFAKPGQEIECNR